MMSLAGGIIALILGIIGLIAWWGYFVKALMAGIPIMFILGGLLAAYLGYEELKDKAASDTFEDDTTDLKSEVESLKEEVKELKEEKESSEEEKSS